MGSPQKRLAWLCAAVLLCATRVAGAAPPAFQATQAAIPAPVAERMRAHSWRAGCPVPIAELAYVQLSHYGTDGAVHTGELVVHRELAAEVIAIFKALFAQRFPVEKMRLTEAYDGDDDRSMADNNPSAFNCRGVPGKPNVFSRHSFGRAIDINPLWNPMLADGKVMPPAGAPFVYQKPPGPGLLRKGDAAVLEFTRRGWTWGGDWTSMKDYQHFQK
jgi:hypothetical protein